MRTFLKLAGILPALVLAIAGCSSPTGGGTEDPPTTYAVSVAAGITGGTVSVSPASGTAGTVITITVTPEENKALKNGFPKAATGDGTVIKLIVVSAGEYTFTLPAAAVTVSAEFGDVPPGEHVISIPGFPHGSVTSPAISAAAGASVTLTVTPEAGYQLKAGTFKVTKTGESATQVSTSTTFTMPAYGVTVSAEFEGIPKSIKITGFTDTYTGEWQAMLLPTPTSAMNDIVAAASAIPSGGNITGPLMVVTGQTPPTDQWTGTGSYYIYLAPRHSNDHLDENRYISKATVAFTQAETIYAFTGNFDTITPPSGYLGITTTLEGQVYKTDGSPYTYTGAAYAVYAYADDPPSSANQYASGTITTAGLFSITLPEPDDSYLVVPGDPYPAGVKIAYAILKVDNDNNPANGDKGQINWRKLEPGSMVVLIYINQDIVYGESSMKKGWHTIISDGVNATVGAPGSDYKWVLED
jgi:hypothetical protein